MRRQLKTLNQILSYKLADLRLFGRAELKGPVLHVLLERLPGDVVDTLQVMEVVRSAVEASLLQGLRKVNVYLWCRGQTDEAPEWSESFVVEPLILTKPEGAWSRASSYRQDYPGMRVLFFCSGLGLGGLYLLGSGEQRDWLDWIPMGLAFTLGVIFPWLKRSLNQLAPPRFLRLGLGLGLVLLGLAVALIWQQGWGVAHGILALLALLLLGLGS
ncbi:hypothetical protein [Synechococcus sp. H70.1]|uniref:hypothetical protein n=1 Tax=Synechococcus sp. H70.1 TaxID=2964527 RepID=UPI0039C70F50